MISRSSFGGSSDEKIRKQENVKILFSHHGYDVLTGDSRLDVNRGEGIYNLSINRKPSVHRVLSCII